MPTSTTPLENIDALAKAYAAARDTLRERITALEDEVNGVKNRKLPGIKTALNEVAHLHSILAAELHAHAGEFASPKPRTVVYHGYKLGFQKARGVLSYNAERTIQLIEKWFRGRTHALLRTKKTIDKNALKKLSASELSRIGVDSAAGVGDEVVIKPITDDLDKLIKRVLENAEAEAAEASEEDAS